MNAIPCTTAPPTLVICNVEVLRNAVYSNAYPMHEQLCATTLNLPHHNNNKMQKPIRITRRPHQLLHPGSQRHDSPVQHRQRQHRRAPARKQLRQEIVERGAEGLGLS